MGAPLDRKDFVSTPNCLAAANNATQQKCMNNFYGSKAGQVVTFLSPLQMIPYWGQNPTKTGVENTIGLGSKAVVLQHAADHAAQPAVQTIFQEMESAAGPVEEFIGWLAPKALNFAKAAAPAVWLYAGGADMIAHSTCAINASPDPIANGTAMLQGIP
jgi:hypothetical protein